MTDYNRRFAKASRHDFNAHRPLALDDDLDAEFTWREPRRVSKNLTVQYDKVLYLIEDSESVAELSVNISTSGIILTVIRNCARMMCDSPIPPTTGCRKLTPSRLLIIKDWAMCWMLPDRSRLNGTITDHSRYLLAMSLPESGMHPALTNLSVHLTKMTFLRL